MSTGLPFSTTWNFSSTAVPPDVNSTSSVALFMFVLSVSQCPTSALSFSNASAPPPGAAFVVTAIVPMHNTSTPTFLAKPFIDVSPFKKYFRSKKNTLIQISSSTSRGNRADAIPLRGVAHNHSHDPAGQDHLQ